MSKVKGCRAWQKALVFLTTVVLEVWNQGKHVRWFTRHRRVVRWGHPHMQTLLFLFPLFFVSKTKQSLMHDSRGLRLLLFRGWSQSLGCSLARQYPCLGQHSLSYHIISLNHRICGEIRSQDIKLSSELLPSPPLPPFFSPLSPAAQLQLPMMLSLTWWSCRGALAVTQTALFLWFEINTSSQLIKACEILQSSLGVSGLSFLTQILPALPHCQGQSCWATLRSQPKLPPLRWQFQVRQSDTQTGPCNSL